MSNSNLPQVIRASGGTQAKLVAGVAIVAAATLGGCGSSGESPEPSSGTVQLPIAVAQPSPSSTGGEIVLGHGQSGRIAAVKGCIGLETRSLGPEAFILVWPAGTVSTWVDGEQVIRVGAQDLRPGDQIDFGVESELPADLTPFDIPDSCKTGTVGLPVAGGQKVELIRP